jgi:hypothetical protein
MQIFAPVFPLQPTHQADLDLSNITILAASGTNAADIQAQLQAEVTAFLIVRAGAGVADFQLVGGGNGGVFTAYLVCIAVPAATSAWPALSTAQLRIFEGYDYVQVAVPYATYATANPTRKTVAHAFAAGGPSGTIMYGLVTGP